VIPLYDEDMTGPGLPIDVRVAVCSGLSNAKNLLEKMESGDVSYDFVEVMACPGGCIGGGGQPKGEKDSLEKRQECIYNLDRSLPIRKSHENPTVKTIYERFLGDYGGEKARNLFHVEPVYGERPEKK
jgi:iron only hydrogenase large subunit-like protein